MFMSNSSVGQLIPSSASLTVSLRYDQGVVHYNLFAMQCTCVHPAVVIHNATLPSPTDHPMQRSLLWSHVQLRSMAAAVGGKTGTTSLSVRLCRDC